MHRSVAALKIMDIETMKIHYVLYAFNFLYCVCDFSWAVLSSSGNDEIFYRNKSFWRHHMKRVSWWKLICILTSFVLLGQVVFNLIKGGEANPPPSQSPRYFSNIRNISCQSHWTLAKGILLYLQSQGAWWKNSFEIFCFCWQTTSQEPRCFQKRWWWITPITL